MIRIGARVLVGLLVVASAASAGDDEIRRPPFEAEGDLAFAVDLCAFRSGEEGVVDQEVYVAISNDQIQLPPARDGGFTGDLRLRVSFLTDEGEEAGHVESRLEPQAPTELDSGDRTIQQVIREKVRMAPGTYHLLVELEDAKSQKVGLFNRMRNIKNSGRVSARVEVPALDDAALSTSDLAFVRTAEPAEGRAVFGRNGIDFDPNPKRYYGLALSELRFYVEIYGGTDHQEGDSYLLRSEVQDASGISRTDRLTRAVPEGASFVVTHELDLTSDVPAGRYQLAFTVLNERTREMVTRSRPFDVLWSVNSWGQDRDAVLQEMALVMTDREFDELEKLSPGGPGGLPVGVLARAGSHSGNARERDAGGVPTAGPPRRSAVREYAAARHPHGSRAACSSGTGPRTTWTTSTRPRDSVRGPARSAVADPAERATIGSRPSSSFLEKDEFLEGGRLRTRQPAGQRHREVEAAGDLEPTTAAAGRSVRATRTSRRTATGGLKFLFADELGNGDYRLIGSEGATVY